MRLALFSDIHGNMPALEAILNDIKNEDIDYTIFLGDAIGLGPKPYECLKLLLDSNIYFNYGNHELYALNKVGDPNISSLDDDLKEHCNWVREQVQDIISQIEEDPKVDEDMLIKEKNKKIYLCHYANKNGEFLKPKTDDVNEEYLNSIFENKYDYIFFGHNHQDLVIETSKTKYISIGSSGCTKDDKTFYIIVSLMDKITFEKKIIKYDRAKFIEDFKKTDYPLKYKINDIFFNIDIDK